MNDILLSIKPVWAEAILDGSKDYEYRKTIPTKEPPLRALLYASSPVQSIVGAVIFDEIYTAYVEHLITETIDDTPHSTSDVRDYFGDNDKGHALHIAEYVTFDNPINVDNMHPPMNFTYIDITDYVDEEQLGPCQ